MNDALLGLGAQKAEERLRTSNYLPAMRKQRCPPQAQQGGRGRGTDTARLDRARASARALCGRSTDRVTCGPLQLLSLFCLSARCVRNLGPVTAERDRDGRPVRCRHGALDEQLQPARCRRRKRGFVARQCFDHGPGRCGAVARRIAMLTAKFRALGLSEEEIDSEGAFDSEGVPLPRRTRAASCLAARRICDLVKSAARVPVVAGGHLGSCVSPFCTTSRKQPSSGGSHLC